MFYLKIRRLSWPLFFAGMFVSGLQAQPETALLHFDKTFYVTGEVVWYKLFLPARLQGQDFSIHLSILNEKGESVSETFLATSGKTACHGYYAIPYDLEAGVYRFLFTARGGKTSADELAQAAVPIYNDLAPLPKDLKLAETFNAPPDAAPFPDDLKVKIEFADKNPPRPRQNIRLKITVTDKNGIPFSAQGSVSVTDAALAGEPFFAGKNICLGAALPAGKNWLSGVYWAGEVLQTDGRPLVTPLLAAFDVEASQLHFAESDANGQFLLQMPAGFDGVHRIQVMERSGALIKIQWEKSNLPTSNGELPYTQGILNYLETSRQRKKIYQLYAAAETDLKLKTQEIPPQPEWDTRRSYQVQDFEHFPDLATFFQEVARMVKFTPQNGKYEARMYSTAQQAEFSAPPLFLLDNKATFDADFIARLDPADVARIELLQDPKQLRKVFPGIVAGGVVRINTLRGEQTLPQEEEQNIFALQGFLPPAAFPAPMPDVAALPALRPLVFWQPDLSFDEQGAAVLSYFQSDDLSTFSVEVVVQSSDGRRGRGEFRYELK
jgi:hypothetical protein